MSKSLIATEANFKRLEKITKDTWVGRDEIAERMFLTPQQVTTVISKARLNGLPIITRTHMNKSRGFKQYKVANEKEEKVLFHIEEKTATRNILILTAVLNSILDMQDITEVHDMAMNGLTCTGLGRESGE